MSFKAILPSSMISSLFHSFFIMYIRTPVMWFSSIHTTHLTVLQTNLLPFTMSTSSTLYKCSISQCDFVGSTENSLKAHRVKTHVMRVKVQYSQPDEALLVDRTNDCFNCARCLFKSPYPTVLQLRTFLHITKSCLIFRNMQGNHVYASKIQLHHFSIQLYLTHLPSLLQDPCLPSMNPPVHPRQKNSQISATWIIVPSLMTKLSFITLLSTFQPWVSSSI